MVVRNLTPRQARGGDKPCISLISDGEKHYIFDLLILSTNLTLKLNHGVRNLTNRLTQDSEKPYTATLSLWWQTLQRGARGRDKSFTGTYPC